MCFFCVVVLNPPPLCPPSRAPVVYDTPQLRACTFAACISIFSSESFYLSILHKFFDISYYESEPNPIDQFRSIHTIVKRQGWGVGRAGGQMGGWRLKYPPKGGGAEDSLRKPELAQYTICLLFYVTTYLQLRTNISILELCDAVRIVTFA